LPVDTWSDATDACAYALVATEAASELRCALLLPEATLMLMLFEAPLKAAPPRLASFATPALSVVLAAPIWLLKISASAMPKAKLASAADSAAALSWALLSPAATLKPRLPEAPPPASSAMLAVLSRMSLSPSFSAMVWRPSTTAMAAESRSMSPVMVGSPENETSELTDRSLDR